MSFHRPIWSLPTEAVYQQLSTSATGLTKAEAARRLQTHGANELPKQPRRPLLLRFLDQLTHFMALLLWVGGALAFSAGTPELAWAIWAVIWINAIFSFSQEYQAEQALAALEKVLPAETQVYREGKLRRIPARELVPGDLLQLEEGDKISADARLLTAQPLFIDASVLTGESLPIARAAEPVTVAAPQRKAQPTEISNLVFAGSTVAVGRGMAVVYATGSQTEFGHVARLTTQVKRDPSTLEVQVAKIVRLITLIAVGMGTVVFLLSHWIVGVGVRESFIFAIGIIVANVPEGLLPLVTLTLAIGIQRMARCNALVRRLSAVETLSATTVICTDKTGTLTKNEMTVRGLWLPGAGSTGATHPLDQRVVNISGAGYSPVGTVNIPPSLETAQVQLLLIGAALCSNAHLSLMADRQGEMRLAVLGDPTEAALLVAALKAGLNLETLQQTFPRLREVPFDSRRRMMTVVVPSAKSALAALGNLLPATATHLGFSKGAIGEILCRCQFVFQSKALCPLTEADRTDITVANDAMSSEGSRVLGVAMRLGGAELVDGESQELEQNLVFIGLVAMIDPPRPEVPAAIAACQRAGIGVTIVTGDYSLTAAAIADQIGLTNNHPAKVCTGEDLGHMSDAQLRQILHRQANLVFARMMPEQKLRLVQAYKDLGQIVAVTGDGVNDAPALRAAHIGIAMGNAGTDVAREAADIVLLDDNFATIVRAIEQGRGIYQNIRNFMVYIISSNVAEAFPYLGMAFAKIPPALTIMQVLAIDLGTDMVPALALGAEQPEAGIMNQPPRDPRKPLLDWSLLVRAYAWLGLMEGIFGMIAFFVVWQFHGYSFADLQQTLPAILGRTADPVTTAIYRQSTTLALVEIVAGQIGNIFACRSETQSIFKLGFFSNWLLWVGLAVEMVLLLAMIYIPPLQGIFGTTALGLWEWLPLLFCPPLLLLAEEGRKRYDDARDGGSGRDQNPAAN